MSDPTSLSLLDAHQLLKQWTCLDTPPDDASYNQIRNALHVVAAHSDYQILGICAASFLAGEQALKSYAQALGYSVDTSRLQGTPQALVADGSVYIKYNPISDLLYVSDYEGTHRGVLVACQSETASGVNEMYGHFPLDLFAEQ